MFETMTYENILADMLSNVADDVDKREGSIIYDALAPCALQLAQTYFDLNNYIDLFYVDTAVGEYLDRNAADYGLSRKPATNSVRKVLTSGPVEIGTRWGLNDTIYRITEVVSTNIYAAVCEQTGKLGNLYSGALENIDNVSGVSATLSDIIISGEEEELDEELRTRIQQYLIDPTQDGNVAQYKIWALEYEGIGTAKVFPLWNGGNTVKIAITNRAYLPAEAALVNKFQEYIDPNSEGLGNGVAPIGSKVTVTGGTAKPINISANVILTEGYQEPEGAENAISNYLASIVYAKNSVSYMRIGSVLLDCPSIKDLTGLTVNGTSQDVILSGDEIPILNGFILTVVAA
ncbi:MAG: baseplate family protein [Herbinix sp.]|jgi:uncharacterized phage protein gp47/JayE|nr:baseplate family protein [Herbinix sp.]